MGPLQSQPAENSAENLNGLPFAHLNLRFNPFGELTRDERARLAVVDLESLVTYLGEKGQAIQFLAPSGSGKSTHLLALYSRFSDARYVQFYPDARPSLLVGALSFFDSFDVLTARQRKRYYQRTDSLACTTHADLSRELRDAGFTVKTVKVGGYDPSQVKTMFERRLTYAQRHLDQPIPTLNEETIAHLVKRYGANIRAMEDHLYDVFQILKEVTHV